MLHKYIVNNIAELKSNANQYEPGDVVITKGYYTINDGGGSEYQILDSLPSKVNGLVQGASAYGSSNTPDGITLIELSTEKYADLILNKNCKLNIRQIGGKSLEQCVKASSSIFDNSELIEVYRVYFMRKQMTGELFIPQGHWCFSDTKILNGIKGLKISGCGDYTTILPFQENQEYIWRVGNDSHKASDNDSGYQQPLGYSLEGFRFSTNVEDCNSSIKTLFGNDKPLTNAALYLRNIRVSSFKDLLFENIHGTALSLTQICESSYHNFRFHKCGKLGGNVIHLYPDSSKDMDIPSSLSAEWFKHLFFDSCLGNIFYSTYGNNNVHNEFGTIIISGSASEYNGVETTKPTGDNVEEHSLFCGGLGSSWNPLIFNIIQLCNIENYGIDGDTSYNYNKLFEVVYDTGVRDVWINLLSYSEDQMSFILDGRKSSSVYNLNVTINQLFKYPSKMTRCKGPGHSVCEPPYYQRDLYYPSRNSYYIDHNIGRTSCYSPFGIYSYTGSSGSGRWSYYKVIPGKTYMYRAVSAIGTIHYDYTIEEVEKTNTSGTTYTTKDITSSTKLTPISTTTEGTSSWKFVKFKVPEDGTSRKLLIDGGNVDFMCQID